MKKYQKDILNKLGKLKQYFKNQPFSVKNISNHWWHTESVCSTFTDYLTTHHKKATYNQTHFLWSLLLNDEKDCHVETDDDLYYQLKNSNNLNTHNKNSLCHFTPNTFIQLNNGKMQGLKPITAIYIINDLIVQLKKKIKESNKNYVIKEKK